ncbi:stonustoxin subunit beta-like [Sinocyclocheilus rhinocerous]|uniref:stonustoxin subunit beta-like n=1 Tax=Sinocyclocheilus rhinocerous TaxID=307959 RepID=UPI0007B7EBE2|nr:PREDICTED: stonustoxin subunit beta-like [Sinocyclocheilus rhinocerous]
MAVWIMEESSGLQQDYRNVGHMLTKSPLLLALYPLTPHLPINNACVLAVDLNTANTHLALTESNRKMACVREQQLYPDHPERFDRWCQVLCRESLTGRCYWEAEWSGGFGVYIAVTYKGISRKGETSNSIFGLNGKSWSLDCNENSITAKHNNQSTGISVLSSPSKRVGVYLNWSAGTLSFYSVSDTHTLTHLHTFNTKFTEPLYAGFGVYFDSSVSLCEIKQRPVKNN